MEPSRLAYAGVVADYLLIICCREISEFDVGPVGVVV